MSYRTADWVQKVVEEVHPVMMRRLHEISMGGFQALVFVAYKQVPNALVTRFHWTVEPSHYGLVFDLPDTCLILNRTLRETVEMAKNIALIAVDQFLWNSGYVLPDGPFAGRARSREVGPTLEERFEQGKNALAQAIYEDNLPSRINTVMKIVSNEKLRDNSDECPLDVNNQGAQRPASADAPFGKYKSWKEYASS